jgi:hypothetical protein
MRVLKSFCEKSYGGLPPRFRCDGIAIAVSATGGAMFYFFQKQEQFLQCEIRTADAPDTFAIVITEPNGSERSQYVVGSAEVSRRWRQLQQELVGEGWWGPCGRD